MNAACVVLYVHQPDLLRSDRSGVGTGAGHLFFDVYRTREATRRLCREVLVPSVRRLRRGIDAGRGQVRFALAVSGLTLELLARHAPDGIASLRGLIATGTVELLATPYHQSMMLPGCPDAFAEDVERHRRMVRETLGKEPGVFWNSDGWMAADVADVVDRLGFAGAVTRAAGTTGAGVVRSGDAGLPVITRHSELTRLVTDHFADRSHTAWPITADRFAERVAAASGVDGQDRSVVGLVWNLRLFGQGLAEITGIHEFLGYCLPALSALPDCRLVTPGELLASVERSDWPGARRSSPNPAGVGGGVASGPLQQHARERLLRLRGDLLDNAPPEIVSSWWHLQSVDHLQAMASHGLPARWLGGPQGYEAYLAMMQACDELEVICETGANK